MQPDTTSIGPGKNSDEATISVGSSHLAVDGRTTWARRQREVSAAFFAELGGEAGLTASKRSLVKRAAVLTIEIEKMEGTLARTEESDPRALEAYQRSLGGLRRLLDSIGLHRKAVA